MIGDRSASPPTRHKTEVVTERVHALSIKRRGHHLSLARSFAVEKRSGDTTGQSEPCRVIAHPPAHDRRCAVLWCVQVSHPRTGPIRRNVETGSIGIGTFQPEAGHLCVHESRIDIA